MKKVNDIGLLGQEYLLWLYWKSCEDGSFSLSHLGLGDVNISIEESISLVSITGDGYSETVKSHDLSELDSVRESIKMGRLPESAKIRIISNELEWFFQMKTSPLKISSVKLPITGENDDDKMISIRLDATAKLDLIMKGLFNTFLLERENGDYVTNLKDFLGIQ
jgi:recombination associated protein RdgC